MALALEQLPPGFRFHPTDEEIIIHYLLNKVIHTAGFDPLAIGEVDLNNYEPWDLPQKAKMGENEWFFFYKKDRKYATGVRTNRATKSGYWKSTGKDREIYNNSNKKWLLGMKKTLVFHKGRAPIGERTNWVIHEYRLHGNFSKYNTAKEEWVVCRVFQKKTGVGTSSQGVEFARSSVDYAYVDDHLLNYSPTSLPPLADYSFSTNSRSFETHHQEDKLKASSKLLFNNINQIQMLQHDHNNSLHAIYTSKINPNPIFHPQNFHPEPFVPYSMVATSNERVLDQPHSRLNRELDTYIGGDEAEMMCKMKTFSCNNSIISHSHDTTGLSNETATTDQEFEGLCFNPSSISDLDSFWS